MRRGEVWRAQVLLRGAAIAVTLILATGVVLAQDGNAGIAEATSKVKSFFANGANLLYAICGIAGLVGAVKVYNKWSAGDPDTAKVASAWFGACIFAVVVVTILKAFFGI